jgi:hypothetical protein
LLVSTCLRINACNGIVEDTDTGMQSNEHFSF